MSSALLSTTRCLYTEWIHASSLATKRVPSETPCAPSRNARASPAPSPIPPDASTGTGFTASSVAGSSSHIDVVPLTWPPASIPCAITASTPAAAAASASATEPTYQYLDPVPVRILHERRGRPPEEDDQRRTRLDRRLDLLCDERSIFVRRVGILEVCDDDVDAERAVGQVSNASDATPELGGQTASAEHAAAAGIRDSLD